LKIPYTQPRAYYKRRRAAQHKHGRARTQALESHENFLEKEDKYEESRDSLLPGLTDQERYGRPCGGASA
jgi:hypothetical protein